MSDTPEIEHDDKWHSLIAHLPIAGRVDAASLPSSPNDASAVLTELKQRDPAFYRSIDQATDEIVRSVIDELDGETDESYYLTPSELYGVVSRASRKGAAIALAGIGVALQEVENLEAQIGHPGTA